MKGIRFVADENGQKVAVQIDLERYGEFWLERYGEFWEDIHDRLVASSREDEKSFRSTL